MGTTKPFPQLSGASSDVRGAVEIGTLANPRLNPLVFHHLSGDSVKVRIGVVLYLYLTLT